MKTAQSASCFSLVIALISACGDGSPNGSAGLASGDDENSILSLTEWQALGFDAGSFVSTASASFGNPSESDFSLLPSAPAIDVGLDSFQGVSAPKIDIIGTPRPCGEAFDVGAFEHL